VTSAWVRRRRVDTFCFPFIQLLQCKRLSSNWLSLSPSLDNALGSSSAYLLGTSRCVSSYRS